MIYEVIEKTNTTKKADILRNAANYFQGYNLGDVYKNYSIYKARAEHQILEEMKKLNGFNYFITSYTITMFCCRFETSDAIYFFTPAHNYKIEK